MRKGVRWEGGEGGYTVRGSRCGVGCGERVWSEVY